MTGLCLEADISVGLYIAISLFFSSSSNITPSSLSISSFFLAKSGMPECAKLSAALSVALSYWAGFFRDSLAALVGDVERAGDLRGGELGVPGIRQG